MGKKKTEKPVNPETEKELYKLTDIISQMADSVLITDAKGVIEYVNPAFERLTGYASVEVVGKTSSILKSGVHTAEFYRELWATILRGDVFRGEITNRRKNGELYTEMKTISPIRDINGQITNFVETSKDNTENKKITTALQESEKRFKALFESNKNVILVIKPESGRIVNANSAAVKFYGYPREVLVGMNIDQINQLAPEKIAAHMMDAKDEKRDYFVFPHRLASGEVRTVEVRSHPILIDNQEMLYSTILDITGSEKAKETARRQSEQLQLLYEASQRLNRTLDPQEIYQTICDFMSVIAPNESMVISDYDDGTQQITCRAYWIDGSWLDVSSFPPIPLEPEGQGTQSRAIRTGNSLLFNDYQAELKKTQTNYLVYADTNEITEKTEENEDEEVPQSAMIVPLKIGDKVTGVLQVLSFSLNAYTEDQLKLLEALSLHIAFAEQNAMLYSRVQAELRERTRAEESLRKLNRTYSVLNEVNKTILRVRDPQQLFEDTCRLAVEKGGFRMVWIGQLDGQTKQIKPVASAGEIGTYLDRINIDLADNERRNGPAVFALQSGINVIVNDIENDPRMSVWRADSLRMGYRSLAVFPVIVRGEARATLSLYESESGFFNEDEVLQLTDMAADIAFALNYLEQEGERSQAEDALWRLNEEFRMISDNTVDVIWMYDVEKGRFNYVNSSIEKLLGYTREEALEQSMRAMLTSESYAKVQSIFPDRIEAFAREPGLAAYTDQFDQVRKDGSTVSVELTTNFVLKDAGKVQVIGIARDITERKQAELLQETMVGIANAAQSTVSLQDLYSEIHQLIARVMFAGNFYIALYDEARDLVSFVYSVDEQDPLLPAPFTPGEGLTEYVLRTGTTLVCNESRRNELKARKLINPGGEPCQIWMGVPLTTGGRTIGIMAVQHYSDPLVYTEREQHILEYVSSQVAAAIERKQAEERARMLEKRNTVLIENAPDGIVLIDTDSRFIYTSPSTLAIFGYTEQELLGQPSLLYVHPDDKPLIAQLRTDLLREPSILRTLEYRFRHKNGSYRLIRSVYQYLYDEPGVNALVINFSDITDRRLADEELLKSRAGLEKAQSIAHLGSWELDPNTGQGLSWSQEMFHLFDREPSLGVPPLAEFMELVQPQDRQPLMDAQQLAIEIGEPITIEYHTLPILGEPRCLQSKISSVLDPDGKLLHLSGTVQDITDQKLAEAELRESEHRLKQAQQIAHVGSWESDLRKNDLVWSDEIYRIFELDPAQIKLSNEVFMNVIHPADRALVDQVYRNSVKTHTPYELIYRLLMGDGRIKYIQEKCETYYDTDGTPLRSIGTVLDITARRQMELDIRERVKELTCLFEVSRLLNDDSEPVDNVIQKVVDALAPAMQFPEIAVPVMELDGKRCSTGPYTETLSHRLFANIVVSNVTRGTLSVYYIDDEPFIIPEEQQLLDNITGMFGLWLERRQSDALERISTERFNQIAENIQEVFWMYDNIEKNMAYISPAYEVIWGRTRESVYQKPGDYLTLILPEDRPVMVAAEEQQAKGLPSDLEYRIQRPDGSLRWIWDRSFPIFDEQGTLLRTAGVATDITGEKIAHLELVALNRDLERRVEERTAEVRQSEVTYRALFENSNDGIFLLSSEDVILSANTRGLELLGYSAAEMLGRKTTDFIVPSEIEDANQGTSRVMDGDRISPYERRLIRKDGSLIEVEVNLSLIDLGDDQPKMIQSVMRDITRRKQVENQLRESSELFLQFMRYSPVYTYIKEVTEKEGRVLYASENFGEMLGVPGIEMTGKTMTELFPPEFALKIIQDDLAVVKSGKMVSLEEELNGRKYTTIKFPIYQGGRALLAGYTLDITEREQAAEALLESRDNLSIANATLEQASRLKDEFLASMSHELRTPLTGILGLAEVLQMGTYGALNEKQLKYIMSIEGSGRHLLELINDILDLSKIEAGKLDLILEPFALAEICRSSLQLVKGMAHQRKINIEFSIEPASITVRVDARRMKQMLVNLLSNALKFTPEAGRVGLEVKVHGDENSVHICVWDTGIGIKPEDFIKLFKPFTQLDSALSRQYPGTGLGLSLVQRMADMHGGSVTAESIPGGGSRFTIILPWVEDDKQPAAPEASPEVSVPLANQLVIEDKDLDAEHIMRTLRDIGVARFALTAVQGALEKVAALQPGAILLDLNLADCFVSLDLLAHLKKEGRTRDIPVLLTSIEDHRSQAMELGAAGFLVYPYSNLDLQAELAKAADLPALTAPLLVIRSHVPAPVILLADDNENILDMLTDFLHSNGYLAIAAHSGLELLELAPNFHPDLMLVDIQMSGMDELEVMRRVRAHPDPAIALTPIIAVTALTMTGDRELCLQAGANEYMSKPIALKQLLERVKQLIKNRAP